MESFKLFVAACLSPLVIALVIQFIGICLWLRGKPKGAIATLVFGWTFLLVGSLGGLTYESRRRSEFENAPLLEMPADVQSSESLIVVLGTGFNPDPELPFTSQVSGVFLARLLEGVRVHRQLPRSRLLISIASDVSPDKKKAFLDSMIELLQLDRTRIETLTEAESTSDEAEAAVRLRKPEEVIVIATSAGHMPRAMQIFGDAQLKPIAAPTDYGFPRRGSPRERAWTRWIPSEEGIGGNHQWLYEIVAMLWHRVKPK